MVSEKRNFYANNYLCQPVSRVKNETCFVARSDEGRVTKHTGAFLTIVKSIFPNDPEIQALK